MSANADVQREKERKRKSLPVKIEKKETNKLTKNYLFIKAKNRTLI